ncbi:methyl-accepting chemotaxis protein [Fusibacter tunisiensis]|uniref:Methyl-accepting chemotaxis protein n=1 Tax=Fusibacter tunisiensis TaxID=1008308 RepID=A0ABS2MPX8_9FIRM|nr:methyl-accepting chemotaxis protein [Fusibacter tunisiensis]MBM7561432.1 methyl-accepting chemotaxis protein [Fusibacter tunisiensis]
MRKGLATKIILYIGILVIVVTVGMGVTATFFSSNTVTEQAEASLLETSHLAAKEIKITVDGNLRVLQELANRQRVQTMEWTMQQNALAPDIEKLGYLDMAVVSPDGLATYVLTGDTAELGDRGYIQKALEGTPNVSDVIISRVTNQAVLMYAVPIFSNEQIVGVLIARGDGNMLADITNTMGYGEKGFVYMVNKKGIIVAHPDRQNVMEQVNYLDNAKEDETYASVARMVENALNTSEGVDNYTLDRIQMVVGYAPIAETEWLVLNAAFDEEVLEPVRNMRTLLIIIAAVFLLIGIVIAVIIGKSIARPITALSGDIIKISEYDLNNDNSVNEKYMNSEDEIGVITRALNAMRQNLILLISDISQDAGSVAASSEELTATSQQSALAADEVAKTIEEIANGASDQSQKSSTGADEIDSLGEIITDELNLIKVLNQSAETVDKLKNEGFVVLKELENKTNKSNASSKEVESIVIEANQSAEKIERASDMIKNIADQTNLLALNAAIEAARAGEAGKGFAVVADEIRKLAEQSNTFANEISEVIVELGMKTQNAVETMGVTRVIADEQIVSLKETEDKFNGIAQSIESVKNVVSDLNDASDIMLKKKDQMIQIMDDLSLISQQNAAGTEEASASVEEQTAAMAQIADASEELAKLSEAMLRSISKFKM